VPFPLEGFPEGSLFVKRDDRSCTLYGGNKPRKLEFVIGHALARGSRRLVTSGGLGTNHGLATAILGRAVGLATSLVLVDQPITAEVRESLRLHAAWGAEQVYGRNVFGAVLQSLRVLAASALRGERPHLVLAGGSSPRGDLGFVSAGLELGEQVRDGLLPEPTEIWVAVGSGGTATGLVVGLKLAGLRTRVRGVLVSDIMQCSPRSLARAARAVLRLLRRAHPEIPMPHVGPEDFPLDHSQLGAGYGAPTEAGAAAIAIAAEHGIRLDPTYTGKCLAGLRERARRGALAAGPVLFWNTLSSVDVAATAPVDPTQVVIPKPLARIVRA
jgi:D-cysteine desulfhydrase